MHYNYNLTIPKNTAKADEVSINALLNYGILREVDIFFKDGCAGLVYVRICLKERQIFPSNIDEYYVDNNYHIKFEEYFPVLEKPFKLSLRGYSLDDFRQHVINFRFLVLHPGVLGKPEMRPTTLPELEELLGDYEMVGES